MPYIRGQQKGQQMYSLSEQTHQLPAELPELAKYVLIGREKLAAVRAEINAIKKVGLAKEVLEQKRAEAQEIAELVTLSEVKIGAMLKEIPSKAGARTDIKTTSSNRHEEVKPKMEVAKDLGFTKDQVSQFQRMADHEDVVQKAIVEARENDDIISRNAVLKKIEEEQKPHVAFNTGNNEWYTPKEYIELARLVMGSIDCDPASCDVAQETVQAGVYYTEETNGLDKDWDGNVWMNPPYATGLIEKFCEKVAEEYMSGNTEQAVVLVNNATETSWFKSLVSCASAVCFPHGRIRFMTASGKAGAPLQGQAFVYFGDNVEKFISEFQSIGWCAEVR